MKTNYLLDFVVTLTAVVLLAVIPASCRQEGGGPLRKKVSKQDDKAKKIRLMVDEAEAYDDDRFFAFIDSLEQTGDIPAAEADYRRGERYNDHDQQRATLLYLQRAVATDELGDYHMRHYYQALIDIAAVQSNLDNLQECLAVSTKGYEIACRDTTAKGRDWANLFLQRIGSCQLKLRHDDEAAKTFNLVKEKSEALALEYPDSYEFLQNSVIIANNIISAYMNRQDYSNMPPWLNMMEQALERFAKAKHSEEKYDRFRSMLICNKAIILAMTGHKAEGEAAYQEYLTTKRAKSYYGIYDQAFYLECTRQWEKLLAVQLTIDSMEAGEGIPLSLDYLIGSPSTTFKAMLKTGRREEALKKADEIVTLLDSARAYQNKNEASELAVIYETQQKEAQIARQEATLAQQKYTLARQKYITLAIVFAIILLAIVIFGLFRYRASKRLAVAHSQLQEAYGQLEETTTAKERIESELRIARGIQMSMVPSQFPDYEGLDMYAVMMPAREVGGDLYGYVMLDTRLYFCVGDVSGKGIPASLFMAQATRLFETLAKQGMMPAEICTRINDALSGDDNENGMFVTMFVGLVDLTTGHLSFCNAGHNPPVIGGTPSQGDFLQMESNAPIGLWPDLQYIGEEIDTVKGRPLLIYTDGVNEAENPQQQQFGDDRLLSILRDTHYDSSRQVIETLTAAVDKHRNGAEPNDDLTVMCIHIL